MRRCYSGRNEYKEKKGYDVFYELCQNTRDSSTRRVSVVRGSVGVWVMEIEIKEKIDTLEINKSCKKELRKSSITAISIIIFVNSFFIYNNPDMFFIFPLFTTPFALIFYSSMCRTYKYERLFINMKEVSFSSSYFKKNFELTYKNLFLVEDIKEIEIVEYHKFLLRKIFFKDIFEEKPSYVINFTFSDDKILNFACGLEKNEAKRIVRRIEAFLEKQKIYF